MDRPFLCPEDALLCPRLGHRGQSRAPGQPGGWRAEVSLGSLIYYALPILKADLARPSHELFQGQGCSLELDPHAWPREGPAFEVQVAVKSLGSQPV